MRMKRVLQGTALTALAAAAWVGAGTADAAAAEKFPFNNVDFNLSGYGYYDYDEEMLYGGVGMYVTVPEGNREIMVGIASYNANKKTVKIADTAWEVHDVDKEENEYGQVYVDLSKLSVTKDNYIAVKSESTDPVYYRIGASITKQKFKYDPSTNAISITTFTPSANASTLTKDNTQLVYRTQYAPWSEVDCYTWTKGDTGVTKTFNEKNEVFQEYQYQGTTLYLRFAGMVNENLYTDKPDKLEEVTDANDKSSNPAKYDLYNAGFMPSKEVKLNIAKQANGPSVSADYVNGKVNVPAKTQYRVIASGGAMSGTKDKPYEDSSSKTTPTVQELLKLANGETGTATSGTIEVRKAATPGKKAPSKWTRIAIEIPDKIDVTGAKQGDSVINLDDKSELTATGGAITLKDKVKIEVTKDAKKGNVNGVQVTVPTDCKYGVVVDIAGRKTTVKNDNKTKKIKAAAGNEIKISKAGDKKGKTWASEAISIGKTK